MVCLLLYIYSGGEAGRSPARVRARARGYGQPAPSDPGGAVTCHVAAMAMVAAALLKYLCDTQEGNWPRRPVGTLQRGYAYKGFPNYRLMIMLLQATHGSKGKITNVT